MTKEEIALALARHTRITLDDAAFPGYKRAAVLLLLFPENGELSLILTVRTHNVESHKGQISCPGGMCDPSDADAIATAVREMEEEIGVRRERLEILGMLDDVPVPSKFIITPVVGVLPERPPYLLNAVEVEEVFDVPLSFFLDPANGRIEVRHLHEQPRTVWFFDYKHYPIWGATAIIIKSLIETVRNAEAAR